MPAVPTLVPAVLKPVPAVPTLLPPPELEPAEVALMPALFDGDGVSEPEPPQPADARATKVQDPQRRPTANSDDFILL